MSKEQLEEINSILSAAMLEPVLTEELQHNHEKELGHWLSDEFLLFRNRVSVDNYVALDLTKRGDGQFLPFSMCRESNSDDYLSRQGSYYLTLKQIKSIAKAMEIIQGKTDHA